MIQNNEQLPEGTDTIIAGASNESGVSENDSLIIDPTPASRTGTTASGTWTEKLRGSTDNLSNQAGTKARDLLGQGLERGSEALANVSKLIGETADGIDERLGEEFGDYARRAATTVDDVANRLATKNPDELFDDTREFIRKSPGVALAGAAIVGFALTRLLKNGLSSANDDESGKPGPTRSAD